jgi:hypothetical protein
MYNDFFKSSVKLLTNGLITIIGLVEENGGKDARR